MRRSRAGWRWANAPGSGMVESGRTALASWRRGARGRSVRSLPVFRCTLVGGWRPGIGTVSARWCHRRGSTWRRTRGSWRRRRTAAPVGRTAASTSSASSAWLRQAKWCAVPLAMGCFAAVAVGCDPRPGGDSAGVGVAGGVWIRTVSGCVPGIAGLRSGWCGRRVRLAGVTARRGAAAAWVLPRGSSSVAGTSTVLRCGVLPVARVAGWAGAALGCGRTGLGGPGLQLVSPVRPWHGRMRPWE
jgi:hypothetical protein